MPTQLSRNSTGAALRAGAALRPVPTRHAEVAPVCRRSSKREKGGPMRREERAGRPPQISLYG